MYVTLISEPRAQRAILDEFFPTWREFHGNSALWRSEWRKRTGVSRQAANRWFYYAQNILHSELQAAA